MHRNRIFALLLGGLLAIAAGCSSRKPVSVLVTLDGKAVEGATVTLMPDVGSGSASGLTGADGVAAIDTPKKEGVAPGSYKVLVSKLKAAGNGSVDLKDGKDGDHKQQLEQMKQMQSMMGTAKGAKSELPTKYDNIKSTPLTLKIPPDSSPAKIELKSK